MRFIRRAFQGCMSLSPKVKASPASSLGDPDTLWNQNKLESGSSSPDTTALQQQPKQPVSANPAVHLTLVVDASESMQGKPLAAVTRGIRRLLRFLQPTDVLTIWLFDSGVVRPMHCEAQYFNGSLVDRTREISTYHDGKVWLFDALVAAVEDLEAQGDRPRVVKPLVVISDFHEEYGPAEAYDAKNAILWCQVSNLHPILVSAGDEDMFTDVKQIKTWEISVMDTSDAEINKAFQLAGEFVQAVLKRVPHGHKR